MRDQEPITSNRLLHACSFFDGEWDVVQLFTFSRDRD